MRVRVGFEGSRVTDCDEREVPVAARHVEAIPEEQVIRSLEADEAEADGDDPPRSAVEQRAHFE